MKYEQWIKEEYGLVDISEKFETVPVPVQSLEKLLENVQALEGYVKYLTNNNEYLSNAMRYYRNLADQLKNKGEDNGS